MTIPSRQGRDGGSRLRVLLATHSRDRGSTSRTLEAWSRLLPAHRVDPIVTVGGDGPLLSSLRETGTPAYVHPIRHFFAWTRPAPFLAAVARLAWRIRTTGAQLVHVNEHEHYQVPACAARLAGVPVVVHIRFRPEAAMCRWLFKPPYTPARVFFTSRTQMHDSEEAVVSAVPRDRFQLIYNGLDLASFGRDAGARARLRSQWGLSDGTIAIGTASSISSRKRIDHIMHAVAALARAGMDVRGFVAGQPYFPEDEQELARLRQLAADLGIAERLTFLGYVEPSEPLYHAWDICVSASAYETFGMTVLEAMACGCPVVAYPGGSVTEVIGDGGIIVADGAVDELSHCLGMLGTDRALRKEWSEKARRRAREFDVQESVAQLDCAYRAILQTAQ